MLIVPVLCHMSMVGCHQDKQGTSVQVEPPIAAVQQCEPKTMYLLITYAISPTCDAALALCLANSFWLRPAAMKTVPWLAQLLSLPLEWDLPEWDFMDDVDLLE